MKKRLLVSGIGLFFLLSVISARETPPTAETIPMGTTPTINGVISSGEWTDANVKTVNLKSSDGNMKHAQRYLKYNNEMVYFALVMKGESEEVFLWIGDDENWHNPDIRGCLNPDQCTCSDVQYRGLLDMTTDAQQDITGVGIYNADTDETTVETKIPFDSEDLDNFVIEYEKLFTVIYGTIHRSSLKREYINPEPVYIPVPQEPQSLHTDLDKCSCIDVAVTTSKIKRNLGGVGRIQIVDAKSRPAGCCEREQSGRSQCGCPYKRY